MISVEFGVSCWLTIGVSSSIPGSPVAKSSFRRPVRVSHQEHIGITVRKETPIFEVVLQYGTQDGWNSLVVRPFNHSERLPSTKDIPRQKLHLARLLVSEEGKQWDTQGSYMPTLTSRTQNGDVRNQNQEKFPGTREVQKPPQRGCQEAWEVLFEQPANMLAPALNRPVA